MGYFTFSARGGAAQQNKAFPFQITLEQVSSGIDGRNFTEKAPCDTGTSKYISAYEYKPASQYPRVINSGEAAFKVHSGSKLFVNPTLYDETPQISGIITSYQGDKNEFVIPNDCSGIYKEPVMTVYGLNRHVFMRDFFPLGSTMEDTLKIWLGVAFPVGDTGQDYENSSSAFDAFATGDCVDCSKRANTPMSAFIGCNTGAWLKSVESVLVNKSTSNIKPRYERRQILARVPIGEIDMSGNVKQYCNSNLALMDMCIQGIPAKYPMSLFCEYS